MLNNRKEKEEPVLSGVNIAANPVKLKLGKFQRLENWIPGKVNKIKKKRGPQLLTNTPPDVQINFPCPCGGCQHNLSIACGLECPLGQFAEATFDDATQPAGPIIRVDTGSTPDAVFGLAAIYDPIEEIIGLVFWNGEDLTGLATVLDQVDIVLSPGDVLRIEADATTLYDYHVLVNGVSVIDYTDSGHDIDITGDCLGFVELEGALWLA